LKQKHYYHESFRKIHHLFHYYYYSFYIYYYYLHFICCIILLFISNMCFSVRLFLSSSISTCSYIYHPVLLLTSGYLYPLISSNSNITCLYHNKCSIVISSNSFVWCLFLSCLIALYPIVCVNISYCVLFFSPTMLLIGFKHIVRFYLFFCIVRV